MTSGADALSLIILKRRSGIGNTIFEGKSRVEQKHDVIVIGAGTAGIPCAVEAANQGARVLLIDKSDRVGGTLHYTGGHLSGAGTQRQRELGIEDAPEAHYDDIARISNDTMREDLTRLAVDRAHETIDWLQEHGFSFAPDSPRIVYGHEPYGAPRTHYGNDAGLSILEVLQPMLDEAVDSKKVELQLGTTVDELIVEDGRCVGVRVTSADGSKAEHRASAVVLATGGFGFNPEMFAELEGAPLVTSSAPTATGDGIAMAQEIGAGLSGQGTYIPTFGGLPPTSGMRVVWEERPLLVAEERPPWEIYVDRNGLRFIAEDEPSIDTKERALARIPEMTFWTVFDSEALKASQPMVIGWGAEDIDRLANDRVGIHRADTLEELADLAGIDSSGLLRTVSQYNEAVAAGRDAELGRTHLPAEINEGPYYAVRHHALTLITFTGVDVDENLRVRRLDGSAIEGLFAIGEVIGAGATSGNSFCGGMLLTPALTFGRIVGQQVGKTASSSTP